MITIFYNRIFADDTGIFCHSIDLKQLVEKAENIIKM